MVFQPHRFTRTRDLFEDFCDVLSTEKHLLLLDVYPAGERPIPGTDTAALFAKISANSDQNIRHVKGVDEAVSVIAENVFDQGILLVLGAGDIATLGPRLIDEFGMTVH